MRGVVELVRPLAERREDTGRSGAAGGLVDLCNQGDRMGAMRDLAQAFPALRKGVPGVNPWNPMKLDAWLESGGASDWELDTAAFVLHVWNMDDSWSRPFDALQALAHWDHVNRAVLVEWARAAWWP